MTWYRTGADIYANGDAYRDRSRINGSLRDFAIAVFGYLTNGITQPTQSATATVNWNDAHQQIDGFGASTAWTASSLSDSQADLFFSTNTGAGLSLCRNRIKPDGTTDELVTMQKAQALGARVWSAPWSPPASFKDSGTVNGGNYRGGTATNQAYANQLAQYVANMKTARVNLYAISVQNEPDNNNTAYETCVWTAQKIDEFVPYLYNALVATNAAATRIILPEAIHWANTSLYTTTMNDAAVSNMVGIIANHNYDGSDGDHGATTTPAALPNYGKPLWETEVSVSTNFDGSITDALYWAGRIHLFMTAAEASAWHYWWLVPSSNNKNNALVDTNWVPAKRLYAMGNFSRFVRPGFYRIPVNNNTGPLLLSAYKDPGSGNFAIVAINNTSTNVDQTFNLQGFVAGSVTPWLTSASASLASQTPVVANGATFTNTIPSQSIVTLTGQAVVNTPPTLASVPNGTINAGVILTITNAATDADIAAQTLTFTLLQGPTNATLNASNGVFVWRPLISQADSTNLVSVKVSDNGIPSMSATNSYSITVNQITHPTLSVPSLTGSQVSMIVTGDLGPDYTLLTSTNLVNWRAVVTTNPLAIPFGLTDTNVGAAARFYRLQLGP